MPLNSYIIICFLQILLEDMKISEQLIDLVFYLLFVDMYLLLRIQESHTIPNDMVLLHAALVACSLQLLTVIVSPHYQEVAQALTAYYKVYIFKEAAFAAVCVDVKYLQTNDSSRSASPTTEETLNHLWQQCDSSLQFLQPLCQQKLFRECIVNNQELGKGWTAEQLASCVGLGPDEKRSSSTSHLCSRQNPGL
ncbi:nodulin homeobox-like [Salvia splendens]|uniref:nodulin homeobox-like n=1 Tax=Salvia splendens TaxID=180675 RepID=UPI001C262C29|nr:nodulin homeobox-like [Salvia splendens]